MDKKYQTHLNNQDDSGASARSADKRLVGECMVKLKAQKEELDSIIKRLEKFEDKYTIFTDEELGCPCCRVGRVLTMFEWCDNMRKTGEFKNKVILEKVQEWIDDSDKKTADNVLGRIYALLFDLDDETNEVIEKAVKNGTSLEDARKG